MRAHEAKILDTVIFEGPPLIQQKLWPRHCVQNSWGAEFHPDLKVRMQFRKYRLRLQFSNQKKTTGGGLGCHGVQGQ